MLLVTYYSDDLYVVGLVANEVEAKAVVEEFAVLYGTTVEWHEGGGGANLPATDRWREMIFFWQRIEVQTAAELIEQERRSLKAFNEE